MPTLSVIIPCHNHGRHLDEALASVHGQTWKDLEILVVDDGSTDPFTRRLFENFHRPAVRLLRTPNRGKPAACNLGIRESGGRYILTLDADDRIAPTYAEQAIRVLNEHPNVGIVYCRAERFGKKSGPWNLPPYNMEHMLRRNLIFSAGFFRREGWQRAGGFQEDLPGREDYDFWLKLIGQGWGVVCLPDTLFHYRAHWIRSRSKSKRLSRRQEIQIMDSIYRRHIRLYADHPEVLIDRIRDLQLEILHRKERRLDRRMLRLLHFLLRRDRS